MLESNETKQDIIQNITAKDDSNPSFSWDFRDGVMPDGIEVVGGDAEFIIQKDGSHALLLPANCYLKVTYVTDLHLINNCYMYMYR